MDSAHSEQFGFIFSTHEIHCFSELQLKSMQLLSSLIHSEFKQLTIQNFLVGLANSQKKEMQSF